MGTKTLKRVPLDFQWPPNKVWEGYINPYARKCEPCDGSGATSALLHLDNLVGLIMTAGADSVRGTFHPWLRVGNAPDKAPSSEMAELTTGLSGRDPKNSPFGHDSLDWGKAVETIIKAAGLDPEVWGICKNCLGEGIDPEVRADYEAWQKQEPLTGNGYQLWDTCGEGSPISPVAATAEELADWCAENATLFGSHGTSRENWLKMFTGEKDLEWGSTLVGTANYLGPAGNLPD